MNPNNILRKIAHRSNFEEIRITDKKGCLLSLNYYLSELEKLEVGLSREKESYLLLEAKSGNQNATTELFKAHARFTVSVAKTVFNLLGLKTNNQVVSVNDLIQWGNVGFLKAIKKAEPRENNRFLSYAIYPIAAQMLYEVSKNSGLIKLPESAQKIKRKALEITKDDSAIDLEKIAEELDQNPKYLQNILKIPSHFLSLDEVIASTTATDDSLNYIQTKTEFILADEDTVADVYCNIESLQMDIGRALNTLTDRERQVTILFFGLRWLYPSILKGEKLRYFSEEFPQGCTPESISALLKITRQRVSAVKNKAVRSLRYGLKGELLIKYLSTMHLKSPI